MTGFETMLLILLAVATMYAIGYAIESHYRKGRISDLEDEIKDLQKDVRERLWDVKAIRNREKKLSIVLFFLTNWKMEGVDIDNGFGQLYRRAKKANRKRLNEIAESIKPQEEDPDDLKNINIG